MFKTNNFLAIIVLFLFVVCMGSCGGGGGGGGTETTPPTTTQGDISLYSAGDIEDPNFNGIGIDEGAGVSSLSTRKYDLTITQETCGPMGTGFGGYALNNCTEWVAVRRCEKGDPSVVWPGSGRHAKKWLDLAKENGYETGTIPQPGAVAVFWLSYDPCPEEESCKNKALYEYGHVAYVESVNGNEWCISEYNYLNPLAYGERCFSSNNTAPVLIGFIYGTKTSPSTDTVPPSTPTGLTGNAISSSQINLSWTASTDNVGVAGYKIYRNGSYLKSVPTYLTSDTGLSPSIGYCYTVSAYDAAGNESSQSSQTCITTQSEGVVSLPILRWPLDGKQTDGIVKTGFKFGDDWICDSCSPCGEYSKKHTGVDLNSFDGFKANVGDSVYAAESGKVEIYNPGSGLGQALIIQHSGFITNYIHINTIVSDGQQVTKGQKIGTIANINGYHLHFGIWIGPSSKCSHRGSLPQYSPGGTGDNTCTDTSCINDPLFPKNFIDPNDPSKVTYEDSSQQNQSPVISSLTANPSTVSPNGTSTITCNASDPDNDSLTYSWTATGGSISGSNSTVTWTAPSTAGNYTVTCTVSDGKGGSASNGVNINVSTTTLPAPTGLAATPKCDGSTPGIELQWNAVTGATNYEIYRNGSLIYTTSTSTPYFWNTSGLTAGQSYQYQVKAKNDTTTSDLSNTATAIAPNCGGYSISGRVTLNGSGLSGVTITLTGTGSTSATTDSNGNYTFTGAQNGSYTITPSKSGYTFTPSSRSVTVNNANITGQDFTATQTTAGYLSVSPSDRFDSSGTQGGPFSPSSKTYTLSNTGGSSINWTVSKGQSWVSLSSTSGALSPGGSTTVTVSINSNANSLSPSNYVDTVSFTNTTNGNGNTTRTVNLTVNYSTPTITVGPSSLNFGSVNVGTCETAVFVIQHVSGTGPASGTVSASPNPPFSITSGSSFSVSNGAAANVTVQFCPTSSGTFNGTATVSSSATFTGTNTITLTGTGFSGGVLAVTPSDRFDSSGSQGGPFTPSSKTYTLSNTGGSSINWTASKGQNWVILSSTSGTLSPGGSTTVTVSINSNANSLSPSNYVDTVSFTNTTNGNGNTTRTVNLTVNYSTPTITIGPTSLNFGSVQVGTCSTAVFVIQHVLGTGPASGTVSASPNPPFSITSGSSFSVSNGSAANVTVQFCPTSSGTFNGTATVSSSATFTGTNTITLTGTGF